MQDKRHSLNELALWFQAAKPDSSFELPVVEVL
jgi:hypothetical protein